MQTTDPIETSGIPSGDFLTSEVRVNRVAWFGGIAMLLVTAATLAVLLLTGVTYSWQYGAYLLLPGVPLCYAAFCMFVTRRAQLALVRSYQAELVFKLTDLQEMAYRDELTGLFNRRHFYDVMKMQTERAHATKRPLAVVLLDLDGLKLINDEHGHAAGDEALAAMGRVILRHVRSDDVPARLGGDEFAVVMPDTDKRGAFSLARRLWTDLEEAPVQLGNGTLITIAVSIGLAGFPWGGETTEEMIQWADADMYANKISRRMAREAVVAEATALTNRTPQDNSGPVEGEN